MWEIYAYHNTESLAGIFNAIARLLGSAGTPEFRELSRLIR